MVDVQVAEEKMAEIQKSQDTSERSSASHAAVDIT